MERGKEREGRPLLSVGEGGKRGVPFPSRCIHLVLLYAYGENGFAVLVGLGGYRGLGDGWWV